MVVDFSRVKLLVIDLDNTLCNTFHALSKMQWEKAAKALERHGSRPEHVKQLRKDFGRFSFRHVLTGIGMSEEEERVAVRAYDAVDVRPLRLYPDARYILDVPLPKVLVTRGEPVLQKRKVARLGIRRRFKRIYFVPTFEDKITSFRKILKDYRLEPHEVLIIGDRVEEEILDANNLHMPSCLVLRPAWPTHKGVAKPTLTVKSMRTLAERLQR